MGLDRLLPGERRALSLRDGRFYDLEKVRVVDQLLVRREDRGPRGIGLGVQLGAQCRELSLGGGDGGGELTALLVQACTRFTHGDLSAADLDHSAHRQPGRSRDPEQHVGIIGPAPRRRCGRPRDRGRGRSRSRRAALVAAACRQDGGKLGRRGRGVASARHDLDLRSVLDLERHDRRHAAGVGLAVADLELDGRLEALRQAREHRRGSDVQSGGIGNRRRPRM